MTELRRLKISLITHEIGANLMRARSIAAILLKNYDVEVIVPALPEDEFITDYFEGLALTSHKVKARAYPGFIRTSREIRQAITGDIIYALKLRPSTYGVALLERLASKRPVLLDVDDWEQYMCHPYSKHWAKNFLQSLPKIADPNSFIHTWTIEHFARFANQITNVSHFFQRRYGGVLLPNGCNTVAFNPAQYNREQLRREWGVEGQKVVMFVGTPDPYKGIIEVAEAIQRVNRPDLKLVIVGRHTETVDKLLEQKNVVYWGMHPPHCSPQFLSMADMVVLPQAQLPHTAGQMPMKLFEAMAMGLPLIATSIADIEAVLDGCGLVVDNNQPETLAQKINWILENPDQSLTMGRAARARCENLYSWNAMERVLDEVIAPYAQQVSNRGVHLERKQHLEY